MESSFRILHISDIHFGHCRYTTGENSKGGSSNPIDQAFDLFKELERALLSRRISPAFDAVMLSGDFTWRGQREGFETAAWFCKTLFLRKFCTPGSLLVLPGNHDIVLVEEDGVTPREAPRYLLEEDFRSFCACIEGHPSVENFGYVVLFPKVMLVAFNSTRLVNPEKRNFGYVGYDQIYAILESAWKREEDTMGGHLRIAALHHHLLPVNDVPIPTARFDQPERDLTVTFDAQRTLKALRDYNVAVVMHGHMHEPFFQPSEESNALLRQSGGNSRVYVSGAGTICFTPCEIHQFQVIEVRRGKLTVHQLYAEGGSAHDNRAWSYHRLDEKLPPVKEYEPPPEAVQKRHRSEAFQALTSFGRHESAWDLRAALENQAGAEDRVWRLVWKAWPHLYPRADAIATRKLFVRVVDEMRKDSQRAVAEFRARLGTPEAVFAHEYMLEKMIALYRRSRGTA